MSTDRKTRSEKHVFTSDQLPAHLDDRARFSRFRDFYGQNGQRLDFKVPADQPFSVSWEAVQIKDIGVRRIEGTLHQVLRTSSHIATERVSDESYTFNFNAGSGLYLATQRGRQISITSEAPAFVTASESLSVSLSGFIEVRGLRLPRERLLERVANADDLILRPLDPKVESLRHLRRYLGMLLETGGLGDDPALIEHVNKTLLDLVALTLGAGRDSAELARMRGLRAARVTEITALIRAGFADPAFSPGEVARKLGFSPRYINDLLHETGSSFAERVTELRVQRVRALLSDRRHDRLMVSEIAYGCGFNDVSYFNRCFRRRFGASPTQFRGANGGAFG